MSRMTSTQVIAVGAYLEPNFDPASLTVSQLLGVLGYHNIKYPTPYSKPKLVAVFNEEIKAKAAKLRKERIKKDNSIASDDGIMDGATGQPLRKEPVARRSSRRLSRAPTLDEDEEEAPLPRLDPPKRRRSSAQSTLGGPSSRTAAAQPTLVEESEPEEELPIKKAGRSKKTSEGPGAHRRRVSNTAADDSGWEDNNIFQSGAESSSPVRPSPVRPKTARKSAAPLKSRKSSSAPPQMLFSSPPRLPSSPENHFSPPHTNFEPRLPAIPVMDRSRIDQPKFGRASVIIPARMPFKVPQPKLEENGDELDLISEQHPIHDIQDAAKKEGSEDLTRDDQDGDDQKLKEEFLSEFEAADEQTAVISRRIARGGEPIAARRSPRPGFGTFALRFLYIVLGIVASYGVLTFKQESSSIGYCDTGKNTNNALEQLKARRMAIEVCNRENRTFLYSWEADAEHPAPCPLLPLIPWAYPETCTQCPKHGSCTRESVACDHGYLLRSHPLLFFLPPSSSPRSTPFSLSSSPVDLIWKALSELDGLPGLGSVALPPRCVEDPERKRHIGALGKAIEKLLGQERGRRVCTGGKILEETFKETDGGEAKRWGVDLESLREVMKKKTPPHLLRSFDDTFNEAIQQLIQWGGVIIGEDRVHRYVAHKTADLTWDCVVTVKAREIWAEWRSTVFGIGAVILSLLFGRARRAQKRVEAKRVADLVQIALDTLRNQELAHHTDPVTAPQPYLSSLQLRDLILQDEHSVASRSRLWDQVELVVEGNANVRANLQEIHGGDEMRVWRWVGSAGRGTGVRNQAETQDHGVES